MGFRVVSPEAVGLVQQTPEPASSLGFRSWKRRDIAGELMEQQELRLNV